MIKKIYKVLLFLTNNEEVSRYEKEADIILFLVMMISLTIGITFFLTNHEIYGWICMFLTETAWAVDNLRNSRNY
jgi:hypothetical protein